MNEIIDAKEKNEIIEYIGKLKIIKNNSETLKQRKITTATYFNLIITQNTASDNFKKKLRNNKITIEDVDNEIEEMNNKIEHIKKEV